MIQQLISQQGPLPIKTTFDFEGTDLVGVYVAGSGWTNTPQQIGVELFLDGEPLGSIWVTSNETQSHKALMAKLLPVKMTGGPHQLALVPWQGTVTDANDNFIVQIIV